MIDPGDVISSALEDFGEEVPVNGGPGTITVIKCLEGETVLDGEMINRTGPFALASAEAVADLNIISGNNGDTITIGGVDYTVLAVDPDGQGLASLKLELKP